LVIRGAMSSFGQAALNRAIIAGTMSLQQPVTKNAFRGWRHSEHAASKEKATTCRSALLNGNGSTPRDLVGNSTILDSLAMLRPGRAANSSGCVGRPRGREIGLTGYAEPIQRSLPTGGSAMETAEHREPYESRGSRTDLGAPGGETPPSDSTAVPRGIPSMAWYQVWKLRRVRWVKVLETRWDLQSRSVGWPPPSIGRAMKW
jgi:hypothetical protein